MLSRRTFLASAAASPLATAAFKKKPIGLELYSVRGLLMKDLLPTVAQVAKLGYECVEFYAPYMEWTPDYAKQVRKVMDDGGTKCFSTHNRNPVFTPDGLSKAIELNGILGSRQVVMSSAGKVEGLDGWKKVADQLNEASRRLKPAGMRAGFHNHQVEFKPIDGTRPMDVLAKNTGKEVILQFDVGTCVEAGSDPVAWIKQNPGRIASMHCKDWGKAKGYHVLFGEGDVPWKAVFEAAEKTGGIEFYLVEQEGSDYPEMETAERCLANIRKMRA
jgi:sugar phosphate isomerase/epimerase